MSVISAEYDAIVATVKATTPPRTWDGTRAFRFDPEARTDDQVARRAMTRTFMLMPSTRRWLGSMAEQPEVREIEQDLVLTVLYADGRHIDLIIKVILEDIDALAAAIALPTNYAANVSLRRVGGPSINPDDTGWIIQIPITTRYDAE